jgi:release factor glutamine methyltransferase
LEISRLKIKFLKALDGEYPAEEAGSFFNLLTEAYLQKTRLELALEPQAVVSAEKLRLFDDAIERLLLHTNQFNI